MQVGVDLQTKFCRHAEVSSMVSTQPHVPPGAGFPQAAKQGPTLNRSRRLGFRSGPRAASPNQKGDTARKGGGKHGPFGGWSPVAVTVTLGP